MPRASGKRQSRLSFTPLASSSPAAKDYNQQIRDRSAAVTIEDSPSPAKRGSALLSDDIDQTSLNGAPANDEGKSDSEPVRRTQRRNDPRTRKPLPRQQRLDFSSSRDPTSFDLPIQLSPSSLRTRPSRAGMFSSQVQSRMVELSSDDSDDSAGLPSPRTLMKKAQNKQPSKGKGKGKQRKQATQNVPIEDNESDEIAVKGSCQQPDEISDEDDIVMPKRRRRKPMGRATRSSQMPITVDSDSEGITVKPVCAQPQKFSDDDEEDMPTTLGTQRRRRQRNSNNSFIDDSPPPAAPDSDDDVVEVSKQSKKRRRQDTISEEEEEEVAPKTPSSRQRKRSRKMTQQEKEDLADDLDFLGPSSDVENSPHSPLGTQSVQKNARQKALEKLKRKRSAPAEKLEEQQDDENEDEQEESNDGDDDDLQYISSRHMFKADKDDAEFLDHEEEDEGTLGLPEGMPIEFSRYASMKGKELFRWAVEWMVQKKINPGFRREDDIYRLAFQKLDDEVQGLAASKFTSSAWTTQFTIALQSRPLMDYTPIDRGLGDDFMKDRCDACNRTNHPATYEIRFSERPYHRETLENVENDDDDDDDDDADTSDGEDEDEDAVTYDAQGREVPAANTVFKVGRFCCANARTAHRLSHWKYHLNGFVLNWIEMQRYTSNEEVTRRENWSTKKRGKYANKIVDRMEEEGEIKSLWAVFKDSLDEARDSKQGRFAALSP